MSNSLNNDSAFESSMDKYEEISNFWLWYPDLALDLMAPKEGGIKLHSDQRIFMRCGARFFSEYGCFPRGWGKTFAEVATMVITAIRYPNIEIGLTAQTKENAASLLKDKYNELVRYYPMLLNEIKKTSFVKGDALIVFKNDARIDALANAQSSKGQRRKRLNIEESNLMDNVTFEDALEPVVEVGRITTGKLAITNPEELNQQINFFTTPGFRGSDEYRRSLQMIQDMRDLKGKIVLGSDWMLGCWYGRGSSKSTILKKKRDSSPIAFDMNYGGKWVGSATGALVNINRLMNCRTLTEPVLSSSNDND